jgi:hypothetical protein
MPSVREKIDAFESLAKKDNEDPPGESGKGPPKSNFDWFTLVYSMIGWYFFSEHVCAEEGRRFLLPKNNSSKQVKPEGSNTTLDQLLRPASGTSRSNGHLTSDFQSCLEDVWSVRKNVCVNTSKHNLPSKTGMTTTTNPGARLYSRHSAMSMAAQPANNTKNIGSSRSICEWYQNWRDNVYLFSQLTVGFFSRLTGFVVDRQCILPSLCVIIFTAGGVVCLPVHPFIP